jgi:hypothetical protein
MDVTPQGAVQVCDPAVENVTVCVCEYKAAGLKKAARQIISVIKNLDERVESLIAERFNKKIRLAQYFICFVSF